MTTLWRTFLTLALGSTLSFSAFAADFGAIKGLWDFIATEQNIQIPNPNPPPVNLLVPVPGLGSQGASTLTSDEDFAPHRPGRELLATAARSICTSNPDGSFDWVFKDRRVFYSTDGDELATFEFPTISLTGLPGQCINVVSPPLTNRSSSTFAEYQGTRVYVYSRAFYPPTIPGQGVWYIGVFSLDGTLLWDKEFRPLTQPEEGKVWNIVVGRSAVGNLLERGKRRDVIRLMRQSFNLPERVFYIRYTFFDLLNGDVIKDETFAVKQAELDN